MKQDENWKNIVDLKTIQSGRQFSKNKYDYNSIALCIQLIKKM